MSATRKTRLLRTALLIDAAVSGAIGLILALGAEQLEGLLGVPVGLARYAGIALLPFAALLVWLARQTQPSRGLAWAVVAGNALWAIDSVLLLFTGWIAPTLLGTALILFQAAIVAGFAEVQYLGLRRAGAATA